MAVVRAKITTPRISVGTLERPDLLARLDLLWTKKLGLVSAPAGFGKSTLGSLWTQRRASRIGWLWVDQEDNDVDRFVGYLLEAIASIDPALVANTRSLAERSSRPSITELAETLADELVDSDEEVCIVLDEAEHLTAPDPWTFVEHVLRLSPAHVHMLVLSRIDPPLPLARMRMRDDIVELRGSDLLFTPNEIQSIFEGHNIHLNDTRTDEIVKLTSGWPAGVRLAIAHEISAQTGDRAEVRRSATTTSFSLDTLAGDLVDQLAPDVTEVLLAAALLEDLNPPVLEAMIGKSIDLKDLIAEFTRAGVLITSSPRGGGWLRMHPLFRDLFQRQLTSRRTRSEIRVLHMQAAMWLISEGEIASAVDQLLAARATAELIELLETEIFKALDREDWPAVADWLRAVPEDLFAHSPTLSLGRCWMHFFKGNWLAMRAVREQVREMLASSHDETPHHPAWRAELDVLDAVARSAMPAQGASAAETVERLERSTPNLGIDRKFVRGHAFVNRALALECLGLSAASDETLDAATAHDGGQLDSAVIRQLVGRCIILKQRGDIPRLESASADLTLLTDQSGLVLSRGWALYFHGLSRYLRNDLVSAEAILARMTSQPHGIHVGVLREGMLLLSRIYTALDDSTEATAVLRRLREILAFHGGIEMLPSVASFERFMAFLADPQQTVARFAVPESMTVVNATPHAAFHPVTGAVLIASERPGELAHHALKLARAFSQRIVVDNMPYWGPEAAALEAIALSGAGEDLAAIDQMRVALSDPIARHLSRPLIDLGPRAAHLYAALANDATVGDFARFLIGGQESQATVHADQDEGAEKPPAPVRYRGSLLSLLTDRELSVLTLLEQRLSYKEIGEQLFISPLTVKRHAGNIYDKLGVDNRREAVARAFDLGWRPVRP
jgi:LuxR family maltose regulon positive regulatory protein